MKIFSLETKATIIIVAALSFGSSLACSCHYMGVFEEFVKEHPIVVRGTVQKHGEQLRDQSSSFKTMSIVVSETIKGNFPHSEFEFFGDTGMSCLRYITLENYPVGSEHFFILESEEFNQPLMVCGESSVLIMGDIVKGYSLHGGYSTYEKDLNVFLEQIR